MISLSALVKGDFKGNGQHAQDKPFVTASLQPDGVLGSDTSVQIIDSNSTLTGVSTTNLILFFLRTMRYFSLIARHATGG